MNEDLLTDLGEALLYACDAQSHRAIKRGRDSVLAMPRHRILAELESLACQKLDLNDEWHFRRLCELCETLDKNLLGRVAERGMTSTNPGVVEAAKEFTTQ